MKRVSTSLAVVLFLLVSLSASAAPRRDESSPFAWMKQIVAKVKKIVTPLDDIFPSIPKP